MTISAYNEHPLRNTLSQLLMLQSDPSMSDPAVADNETYAFARDKLFAMAQTMKGLLECTPAMLVSTHAVNQLNKHVQSSLNEANSYVSNRNAQHLINAAAHFEQHALPLQSGFGTVSPGKNGSALPDLLDRLSESSAQTIRQLVEERDSLVEKVREAEALAQDLKSKLEGMAEGAARERAEASAAVAKLEQSFAENETERAAAFDAALTKVKGDFSALETTTKGDAVNLLKALEEQKDKAAQIVQVVGNIGVTGNYQRIANEEEEQANFWRWATVLFFGAGVTLAAATFYKFWAEPITAETISAIAVRLLYAIAITAPAWYTARESARHRTNSDRARQTELELASLGPFIELMPPEKKIEIREQMTKLYFGREIQPHVAKSPLDVETVKDLAIELAKVLKK